MDWLSLLGAGAGLLGAITGLVAIRRTLAAGRSPRPASDAADAAERRREELRRGQP